LIDLRTDTVTLPSAGMRAAMGAAEVGDDFYREDPTVQALEARAAEELGKEAALYVPSGTMGNLLAHLTHCSGGAEVVGPEAAHSFLNEGGGPARVAGMTLRTVPQAQGELDIKRFAAMIHPRSLLAPPTGLLWVEQPTRGYVVPLDDMVALRRLADAHEVPIHIDGARIFNAAVALGVPARAIAQYGDSVMFCVSKGLAAPVGSLLVGGLEFIEAARHNRQMVGGGMRQAGIIAAAGLYALDHNVERLAEDHENAGRLADAIREVDGLRVDRESVQMNIFYVEVVSDQLSAQEFAALLRERGVLVNSPAPGRRTVRFATHYGIDASDIDEAIARIREVMGVLAGVRTSGAH
jgi:threonine aldolase